MKKPSTPCRRGHEAPCKRELPRPERAPPPRAGTVVEKLAWKHGVVPREVEETLSGKCRIFRWEDGSVSGETLYNGLGRTEAGRHLSVFFIRKGRAKALIVTARDMNTRERRRYGRK